MRRLARRCAHHPLCSAFRSLVDRGFALIGREGDWDNGKLLMMNAVEAASEAALAREDLVGCYAEVIDRVLPYLRSHALFEGPRGDYSGWTPYTSVQNAFEEAASE
jgi:hypothetical protein